jgi:CHAT domain-containing protein
MKSGSEALMTNFSDEFAGFYLNSYYHILKGDIEQAQASTTQAMNIQPLLQYAYFTQAYIYALQGNTVEALNYLEWAMQLSTFATPDDIIQDLEKIEFFTKKDLSVLKNKWRGYYQNNTVNVQRAGLLDQCVNGIFVSGHKCESLDRQFAVFSGLKNPNPRFQKLLPLLKAVTYYYSGRVNESINQLETFVELSKNNPDLYWKRSYALHFLSTLKLNAFDSRGALLNINEALTDYAKLSYPSVQLAFMQMHKINVINDLDDKKEEKIQMAYQLEQTANQINNDYYRARAYGVIGATNFFSRDPEEKQKATDYLFKAYNLAQQINDDDLSNSVNTNYALVKAKQGLYKEAIELSEDVAQNYLKKNQFQKAQNAYNNLGFVFVMQEDYAQAIIQFEKSIGLIEKVKKDLNAKQKLEYMNDISSTFEALMMCLKETNQVNKLFEIQEKTRGGYLKDLLGSTAGVVSVKEAQDLLKNDELLLTYSIGRPGEIIITAISKNSSEIRYNFPIEDLIGIKKTYTDRIKEVPSQLNAYMQNYNVDYVNGKLVRYGSKTQNFTKDDFVTLVQWTREVLEDSDNPDYQRPLNDFLHLWYNLTLLPVQDLTSQYKNVVISVASELNYLPFEAFLNPKNEYFVTTNDVRYIPNMTIVKTISKRQYSPNRKSVIAFGGAKYQPSGNVKATARSMEDFYKVSDAVTKKMSQGIYNFKPELEAIGFGGANYLQGTLNEVEYIGTLAKDTKVITGMQMTESYFKQANRSGELKQYKNLIISSHGFTGDVIPEFSGVMFTQPDNGDGNEDTFLLAPEIAQLNLNADLTILSACSTGVGKLYSGEGINGLNTSFMVAGSNSTMLSLWPVDDASTALTMQLLFQNIIQYNEEADVVLNEIKRAFINGQYGDRVRSPKFWAPFLYNGL